MLECSVLVLLRMPAILQHPGILSGWTDDVPLLDDIVYLLRSYKGELFI